MADEDGPHDYESIDDFLCGKPEIHRHSLERTLSEEATSHYRQQSRPFTLPRGSYSVDGGDPANTSLQFPLSPPRVLPHDHNAPMYQPKVPICISEPGTPVSAKQNNANTLRSRPLLEDMQVPPPITRSNKPPPRPPKPSKVVIERKEPRVLSAKPYSLSDFCAYEPLPKMVRVSAGYYGETEKTSISEGEEFVFYLLKTVQAIPARPVGSLYSSEKFHIPISSMLKIAVIDKHSDSIRKYVYSSPGDLMTNRKECPRVVCVTKDHFIQSTLLPAGTLLFLDEKPNKKLMSEHRIIRCKTRKNKLHELSMNSSCHLTTHPADTQIYIREYQALVNKFPVDVQLFHGDSDTIYEEPSEVTSSIGMTLTLEAPIKQKSIIAKTDLEGTRRDNPITVEIPFDLPIEIEAIEREEENMEQIYSEVMDLYANFNPESIERSYATHEWNFPKELDDHLNHEYESADIDYLLECPNTDYEPLQEVLRAREQLLQERQASGASSTDDDVQKLKEENKRLQEEIERLQQKKHGDYTKLVRNGNEDDDSYTLLERTNVQDLKSLDESGVSQLLQNMGLPQYVESFKENHICGTVFSALKENDFSDLVQSSLHKKRLMLIASGQTSIRKYFDSENPYGVTTVRKE